MAAGQRGRNRFMRRRARGCRRRGQRPTESRAADRCDCEAGNARGRVERDILSTATHVWLCLVEPKPCPSDSYCVTYCHVVLVVSSDSGGLIPLRLTISFGEAGVPRGPRGPPGARTAHHGGPRAASDARVCVRRSPVTPFCMWLLRWWRNQGWMSHPRPSSAPPQKTKKSDPCS